MTSLLDRRTLLGGCVAGALGGALTGCAPPMTQAERANARRITVLGAVGPRIRYAHGGSRAGLARFVDAAPLGFPRLAAETVAGAIRPVIPTAAIDVVDDTPADMVDAFRVYGVGNERCLPYLQERFRRTGIDKLFVVHDARAFRARSGSTPVDEFGVGLITYGPVDDNAVATYANVTVVRIDVARFMVEAEQGAVWGHPTLRQPDLVRLGHPLRGQLGATLTASQLAQAAPMFRHLLAWSVSDAASRHGFPVQSPPPPPGIPRPIGLV